MEQQHKVLDIIQGMLDLIKAQDDQIAQLRRVVATQWSFWERLTGVTDAVQPTQEPDPETLGRIQRGVEELERLYRLE